MENPVGSGRTAKARPHAIMLHHFYDHKHIKGQGAISADQFERIIRYYQDYLLSANEWLAKARNKTLENNDICLSFDDALLCQYEIAVPILEKYSLTAFWFVYSAVLNGGIEMLEVYRKFRTEYFEAMDDFYDQFFLAVNNSRYCDDVFVSLKRYSHDKWKHFPFYSKNDTKFRYIRDVSLDIDGYNHIMCSMIQKRQIDITEFSADLWMNSDAIKTLHGDGHVIGLHSHTHPTDMSKLSDSEQEYQYSTNYKILYDLLGEKPVTMSHPCNAYNNETLSILESLNIEIGFRANMAEHQRCQFEFPREDHANIIRKIENEDNCIHQ